MSWNTHVKYQSSNTHCSKVISKVKFRTELWNDRMTDTCMPLIFDLGGIKKTTPQYSLYACNHGKKIHKIFILYKQCNDYSLFLFLNLIHETIQISDSFFKLFSQSHSHRCNLTRDKSLQLKSGNCFNYTMKCTHITLK